MIDYIIYSQYINVKNYETVLLNLDISDDNQNNKSSKKKLAGIMVGWLHIVHHEHNIWPGKMCMEKQT